MTAEIGGVVRRMRQQIGAEDGFVAVVAIAVVAMTIVLVGAGVAETLSSRTHASQDTRVKRALQGAADGIQAGRYRANQISLANADFNGGLSGIVNTLNCLSPVDASGQ